MKSSEQLLREAKRWPLIFLVCFILAQPLEWLFPSPAIKANEPLFDFVGGAVILLLLFLIDCTEVILAAIKEEASKSV